MTLLRAAAETHTGYVRSTNQDLALVSGDLVAVADGMGGHLGGEVAARTAIEELVNVFGHDRTGEGFVAAARRANKAVWRKSRLDRSLHGMGTTLTAAALVPLAGAGGSGRSRSRRGGAHGGTRARARAEETQMMRSDTAGLSADRAAALRRVHLLLLNVGDSRAYVLDRTSRALRQLTEDHSVVEEMVRQGELTPAEAAAHPHRHVLTRALGVEADVALDVWDLDAEVGSRFLLCSDGLTNEVPDTEIADVLASFAGPEEAVSELVTRALAHGGMDNVTVVVADLVDDGDEDPRDVPVQLVPPGAPQPELPVSGTPELTEAVPVTEVPRSQAIGLAGGESAGGESAGGESAGGQSAGGGSAAALLALGDEEGAHHSVEPSTPASAGTSAADVDPGGLETLATSVIGAEPLSEAGGEGTASAPPAPSAEGRSMTVRPLRPPPSIDGTIGMGAGTSALATAAAGRQPGAWMPGERAEGAGSPHTRPVVLVPKKRRGFQRDRILTVRVALFVVLLVGLLAGTAAVVIWYDQSRYFVGLDGNDVAIYQGEPGGMLWFKPQLIETSPIHTGDLLSSSIVTLRGGITESSLKAAEELVARLKNERLNAFYATTTTTTTTTTLPPTTTRPTTLVPIYAVTTTTTPAPPQTSTSVPPTSRATTTTTRPPPSTTSPPTTSTVTTTTKPTGGT